MYGVELSEHAQKFLSKLDKSVRERVENRLRLLGNNPVPSDAKFIGRNDGEKIFRYRIGDYRALYKIKENAQIVLVAKIEARPKVYG